MFARIEACVSAQAWRLPLLALHVRRFGGSDSPIVGVYLTNGWPVQRGCQRVCETVRSGFGRCCDMQSGLARLRALFRPN